MISFHQARHLGLQCLRRVVQLSVLTLVAGMVYLSLYAHYRAAHVLDDETEMVGLRGEVLSRIDHRVGRMDDPQKFLDDNKGTVWSMRIGGWDLTDPLAAAEAIAASRSLHVPLLMSILVPVLVTLVLGKVFCSWICPGGALYGLIGWPRLLRIKLDADRCTKCRKCLPVCEPGLDPVRESYGIECDNCGECVRHCPDRALGYTIGLPVVARRDKRDGKSKRDRNAVGAISATILMLLVIVLSIPTAASAHHILGLPHYSYKENYPQVPVLEYPATAGPYQVLLQCYPGEPVPGEPTNLAFYIKDTASGQPYEQPVGVRVLQTFTFGGNLDVQPRTEVSPFDGLHKISTTFPEDGEYVDVNPTWGFEAKYKAMNIAPILTWTVWWGGLVVLIMFAGKAWCYVCPWDAVASWMEKLRFWKKSDEGLGLDLSWPRILRNILIATVLFVGLTWVELGFGVTMKRRTTAYLGIAMLLMAIVSVFLFRRKSFCRYGCLVGRVSGLYAMFSGIEIRPRKEKVCRNCAEKPCVRGTRSAYGCPTFLYPGKLSENTYCIQCGECLQTCPEDNLAVNLRPWGADLASDHRGRADEAYLALLMLSITAFHGLTMTPNWRQLTDWLRDGLSLGHILAFSLGMALLMLGPIVIYGVLVAISYRLGASKLEARRFTYHDYFVRYAYALLPIALFYHLAHNLEHLLMEGPKVVALASDPFGWRWNLFGTLDWNVPPLVSLDVLWILQILLVLVGHVYSLWIAGRTSTHVFGGRKRAFLSQIPLLAGMILFSVFSLWLLKQPMEMRTSAM